MYSVEQLQALDYLLKRITREDSFAMYNKNLKLVIEFNNLLWYGDFIEIDGRGASQLFIDDAGRIVRDTFYPTGNNAASPFKQIWDSFVALAVKADDQWWGNPFNRITDLPLLFETLIQILERADISVGCSAFRPYLLNAQAVDGTLRLPFINLGEEKIKLVSIIELHD
ncbi:hypothetical protein [Brevibacillus sp. SAFN-007a]|uniref:hypothetical protein n=1 Tax=Brevibacillus sp. SAFN-007a TaxID=3436862 RepID=UPI003F800210